MNQNWSGCVDFAHTHFFQPTSHEALQTLVQGLAQKGQSFRVVGSGHSFTPLCQSHDALINLDAMQGVVKVDKSNHRLTTLAGTKLHDLGKAAFKEGMALPNQGDIDRQSIAGAISTGTHGTGLSLPSMSAQVHGLTLLTSAGEWQSVQRSDAKHHEGGNGSNDERVNNEQGDERVNALAVSLGCMGLISELTLNLMPTYVLDTHIWSESIPTILPQVMQLVRTNRHVELMYFPWGNWAQVKCANISQAAPQGKNRWTRFNEDHLENAVFKKLNQLALSTNSVVPISKLIKHLSAKRSHVDWSHRAFPTVRTVGFQEMEFACAVDQFEEIFEEITHEIKVQNFKTLFPIEIRFTKGDPLWLSPFYQQDSVCFAIHVYQTQAYEPFFSAMQAIFMRHKARPHWGKWHSLNAHYFETVYPKWHDFLKLRQELDPCGRLLNPYLTSLFYPHRGL